jgi:acyl-homoserine lactone acylase PvdQ
MYYTIRVLEGQSAEMLRERKRTNANETNVRQHRRMRTFGWFIAAQETAKRVDGRTRELLDAYSAGVNACFAGGQSYTQFVRLDDPDQSMSILTPEQSEDRASKGWQSTLELWKDGRLHPAPLSDAAVRQLAVSRRVLK